MSSLQAARARARLRHIAPVRSKPRIRVMAATAAPSVQILPDALETREDDDAPFDPPSHDDFVDMGLWDEGAEEETIFAPTDHVPTMDVIGPRADLEEDVETEPDPAAWPRPALDVREEEPPSHARVQFERDAIAFIASQAVASIPSEQSATPPPAAPRSLEPIYDQPVPPIVIHGSWDRHEIAASLDAFAADRRMARAAITIERGGLDAALIRFANGPAPDLLILDSTLRARELLAGVDKLIALMGAKAKIFVVGAVNDIGLLRDLSARGVKYVVPPLREDDLARAVCGLYAEADSSRVIAVMGARGGIGASTVAHNLAWSIAERCGADTTLIDLDLAFGAAAFNVQRPAAQSVTDVVQADPRDIAAIERAAVHHTPRLQILAAPTDLVNGFDLDALTLETLLTRARRATSYVVLDLPHAWTGSVRRALALADDVLIVAGPDLASLRNADNMLRSLKAERADAPLVVMSMTGVPKRPEIAAKEFTQALGQAPVATLAYEPELFGAAAFAGQMIGETAPRAKAAHTLEALASALTGLPLSKHKKKTQTLRAAEHAIDAAAVRAQTPDEPLPAANDDTPLELTPLEEAYIAKARATAEAERMAPPRPQTRLVRVAIYVAAIILLSSFGRTIEDHEPSAEAAATPEASSTLDDPAAQTREAWALLAQGRNTDAIARLRPIGERGYAPAQYLLARAYQQTDPALARQWTERAARTGHARAMHDLGVVYASGHGAPRDDEAAFRWFRQAAEFNIVDSQYNLGVMYQEGRGVTANAAEALRWYLIAARRNDSAAAERAAVLQARLTPEDARHAQARADAFESRAPRD